MAACCASSREARRGIAKNHRAQPALGAISALQDPTGTYCSAGSAASPASRHLAAIDNYGAYIFLRAAGATSRSFKQWKPRWQWTNLLGDPVKTAQPVHRMLAASRIPEPKT
jgi:hypothetical protein